MMKVQSKTKTYACKTEGTQIKDKNLRKQALVYFDLFTIDAYSFSCLYYYIMIYIFCIIAY